ncbi:MAG: AraC family transcriptional regulator [Bacilli bacterium]|jgi:AraC-like DNA-binding protein/predicted transcriptional regulator YdeE|nr:helix-turn-helix transcriptional regulator [Acholeplasmataceae bacterium]
MNIYEAVKRMQDYIEDHWDEEITLADLANVSYYSPWYSYRLFVKLLNMTPSTYIRRLRLSKSALKLRDNQVKIIDVAFESGYSSVDGYQRAFNKEFGINPYEYSRNPIPICLFLPFKVYKRKEKKKMEKVKNIFITLVTKPQRKVIIKRGIKAQHYFEYCGEVGCDVFGILKSIKSISGEPVCMWLPPQYIKESTSTYVQGVEVNLDYDGAIPDGFDVIELPEATFLMFQGEPFEEEDYSEAIDEVWKATAKYTPEVIGYAWDYDNPKIQLEPIGERGYIELWPVKKVRK